MTKRLLLLIPLTGACFSTTSSPGEFVTGVRVHPEGLVTTRCDLEVRVTHTLGSSGPSERASSYGCHEDVVTFPETGAELPAHCWSSIELWVGAPAAEALARWAAIPSDCRALVAGGRP